ncbi:MAG: nucleoside phosphorylase [Clostridia bacterium]|nr:nucleoside phosphorylase [Clostridia bacterium]
MSLRDFDPDRRAVIEPGMIWRPVRDFPDTVVSVFSLPLFERLAALLGGRIITRLHDADGVWPVYEVIYRERRLAFVKARVGAPACVGIFEDVLALGAKRIVLCGNCGVLDKRIADCSIILPDAAIRDEGTSYHYAPAADLIPVNREGAGLFLDLCAELGYTCTRGVSWTTDAFYRETKAKVAARRAAGAVCVEMECAAMQAMCDFRGAWFFQFFYAADNLDHTTWEPRSLGGGVRLSDKEKIGLLAFEFASRLPPLAAGT